MKKYWIVLAALVVATMLMVLPAFAETADVLDYLTYITTDGYVSITDCDTSISGEVVIPDTIEGYPVKIISPSAFSGCENITSLDIPDTVTTIHANAFAYCSGLETIFLPDNLTALGEKAFYQCKSITYISIPDGVTVIGPQAFMFCENLREVRLSNSLTALDEDLFTYCEALSALHIPASVESIDIYAFNWMYPQLESITVDPENPVFYEEDGLLIRRYASSNSPIDESIILCATSREGNVHISANRDFGSWTFAACTGITSFTVDEDHTVYTAVDGVLFDADQTTLYRYPAGRQGAYTIPVGTDAIFGGFSGAKYLTDVTFPQTMKDIFGYSFFGCTGLTDIEIRCETIYQNVFRDCTGLKTVRLAEGVKTIGDSAFVFCTSVETIVFPSTLQELGSFSLIYPAKSVQTIYYNGTAEQWDTLKDYSYIKNATNAIWCYPTTMTDSTLGVTARYVYAAEGDTLSVSDSADLLSENVKAQLTGGKYLVRDLALLRTSTLARSVTEVELYGQASIQMTLPSGYTGKGCKVLRVTEDAQLEEMASYEFGTLIQFSISEMGTYILYVETCQHTDLETLPGQTANCTDDGLTEGQKCTACGKITVAQEVIPALGHAFENGTCTRCGENDPDYVPVCQHTNLETLPGQTANCTDDGLTEGQRCADCGEITVAQQAIPALGHDFVENICTRCGYSNATVVASGECGIDGNNVTWTLYETGYFYIAGTGEMAEITSIYAIAWYDYMSSITQVEIAEGVTTLSNYAFRSAANLQTCQFPTTLVSIGEQAFRYSGLTEAILSDGVQSVESYAFGNCASLTRVQLGENTTDYGTYAFAACTSLTEVYIPASAGQVSNYMFNGCTALTKVTIAEGVTKIGNNAFYGCTGLQTVEMPNSVTTLGNYAFYNCKLLSSITLGDQLTAIPEFAFNHCDALTEITIPASVTSIGNAAFASCDALSVIRFCGDAPTMAEPGLSSYQIFYNVTATVYYPSCSTTWTSRNMYSYGGTLTWVATGEHQWLDATCEAPKTCALCATTEGEPAGHSWDVILQAPGLLEKGWKQSTCARCGMVTTEELAPYLTYEILEAGTVTITKCSTDIQGHVVLPQTIEGYPVTLIGSAAFRDCTLLTYVEIPEGVISVGQYAFQGCTGLEGISLPDSLTQISLMAFYNCSSLREITIPKTVKKLTTSTFANCTSLETIVLHENITLVGASAFANCTKLKTVYFQGGYPTLSPGIDETAFTGVTATVYYPANDTSWHESVRRDYGGTLTWVVNCEHQWLEATCTAPKTCAVCGMTEGDALKHTEGEACIENLTEPTCLQPGSCDYVVYCTVCNEELSREATILPALGHDRDEQHQCTRCGHIGGTCGENLTWELDLETGLLTISGTGAMTDFAAAAAPWYSAYDAAIKEVVLTEGVTTVGKYAFYLCGQLERISLPASLTEIGYQAFYLCAKLDNVTLPAGVTTIGNLAFKYCRSLSSIEIPDSVTAIGANTFEGCTNLITVVIGDGVTSIGESAFVDCSNLANVTLGSGVARIQANAFKNCTSLVSIRLPESVNYIGSAVFANCTNLTEVNIPEGVEKLQFALFSGCTSLTVVEIPTTVEHIERHVFSGCTNLIDSKLPQKLASLGDEVFKDCINLLQITFQGNAPSFGANVFSGISATVSYPAGNASWTTDVMQLYGGTVTWKALCLDGHTWMEATCTAPKTCSGCGETEGEALGHTEEIIPGAAATCTEDGLTEGVCCCVCGETLVEQTVIPATGHIVEVIPGQEGTCTEDGLTEGVYCSVCGEVLVAQEKLPAVGHTPGEVCIENVVDPTCVSEGYCDHVVYCTVCGEEVSRKTVAIDMLDHTEGDMIMENVVAPSCTETGSYECVIYCAVCGVELSREPVMVEPMGHTEEELPGTEATCTTPGVRDGKKCVVCGAVTVPQEEIPALGHDYQLGQCSRCDSMGGTCGDNLTWVLTEDGQLTISGVGAMEDYEYYENTPWYWQRDLIQVVIMEEGVTNVGNWAFANCPELVSVTIPSTVTVIGKNAFSMCTRLTDVEIPRGVITIGNWAFDGCSGLYSMDIPDTVTSIGKAAFYQCINLSQVNVGEDLAHIGELAFFGCTNLADIQFTGDAPTIGENAFKNVQANAFYPAYNETWTESVMQPYGGTLTWQALCFSGHTWMEATCTAPKTCLGCGKTQGVALAHIEEVIPGKEATCVEVGLTEGKQCTVCGEVTVAQEVIAKLAHTDEIILGQAPTCTEPGLTEGKQCAVCGEVTIAQEEIPALGHEYKDGSCTRCGEEDPDYEVVIGLLGDLNGNGEVNSVDVNLLFRYICGDETLTPFTEKQLLLADVNQDGEVNSTDVNILFRYVSRDSTLAWVPEELKK